MSKRLRDYCSYCEAQNEMSRRKKAGNRKDGGC